MTKRYDDRGYDPCGREIDLSSCPYYRGVGTCESGCYDEPACITGEPSDGWPSRRSPEGEPGAPLPYPGKLRPASAEELGE